MPIDAAELRDCEDLAMALAEYAITEMAPSGPSRGALD